MTDNVTPNRTRYLARSHQMKVIRSTKRNIFMGGGVGCGKTDAGSLWVVKQVKKTPKGVIGIVAANSYSQLIDSTLRNLYKNFRSWNIPISPSEPPTRHHPVNLRVWNGVNWIEIICRSLDNYALLSGVEVGWTWTDECWMTKREAIDILFARLRDRRMENQMLFTTTLDDPSSWMYELFVDNFDEDIMEVLYATTFDNEKNLAKGYISTLQRLYDRRLYKRMVLSKWVSLTGEQIYHSFDRTKHSNEIAEFDPNLPILWSHDFNIGVGKPMSSCLCQMKNGESPSGIFRPELHVFDEIILDGTRTQGAIEEFQSSDYYRKGLSGVVIYGDATGRHRDTRSNRTDYTLLENEGFTDQKVPTKNPPIRSRHNAVNSLLQNQEGDVRLIVHPRCKTILKGLETVHIKKGAQYIEEETREQHVTTALGYLVNREFPIERPMAVSQEV